MSDQNLICLVDDDESVRESMRELFEAKGFRVEDFRSALHFLAGNALQSCKCLIADIRMPEMDGLALQDELNRRGYHFPVIIITGHGDVPLAVRAMKAGAVDFIEKPFKQDVLMDAVSRALAPPSSSRASDDPKFAERIAELTDREREVLDLLILGDANKVIAQKLSISFRTVEIHRARILSKMQAASVAQLVRMVITGNSGS